LLLRRPAQPAACRSYHCARLDDNSNRVIQHVG
jgi:hypothetical protein